MKRPRLMVMAVVAAGWLAPATARADDPPPAPPGLLTAAAAWNRIVGNTVSGTTPDGPYSEFFAPDGRLMIVDNDGKAGGRWTLRDARVCTQVDDDDEECRNVEVTGSTGAFVDEAGSRYPFDIVAGNPKGL